jgi:hypothetical protein
MLSVYRAADSDLCINRLRSGLILSRRRFFRVIFSSAVMVVLRTSYSMTRWPVDQLHAHISHSHWGAIFE